MDRTTFRKLCDMLHIHEGFRPSKNMEMDEKCNLEKEGNIILMNIDMTRGQRHFCNLKNPQILLQNQTKFNKFIYNIPNKN